MLLDFLKIDYIRDDHMFLFFHFINFFPSRCLDNALLFHVFIIIISISIIIFPSSPPGYVDSCRTVCYNYQSKIIEADMNLFQDVCK